MSRLDYVTITIVVICLIALGFLVYRTVEMMTGDKSQSTEQTESTISSEEDGYEDEYDLDGEETTDEYDSETLSAEEDLSDEELDAAPDYEVIDEEDPNTGEYVADEEPEEDIGASQNRYSSTGDYLVVAGSFRQKSNAEKRVRLLKEQGFDDAHVGRTNRGAYAVAVAGSFESQSDASDMVTKLKDKGFKAFVKKSE